MNNSDAKKPFFSRWYVITTIGLMVAFILTSSVIVMLLFSNNPNYTPEPLNSTQFEVHGRILNKIMSDIIKSKPDTIKEIVLDEIEVNAVFVLAENGQKLANFFSPVAVKDNKQAKNQNYKLKFKNGKIIIDLAIDTNIITPAGRFICLKVSGIPSITSSNVDFLPDSTHAGAIPVPDTIASMFIANMLDKIKNEEYYKIAREIIVSTEVVDNQKIKISYYPYRARKNLLRNFSI